MENFLIDETKQYEFEIEGIFDGIERKGKFKCKYPSITDEFKIQALVTNLLDGSNPAQVLDEVRKVAYMVATNEVLLLEKPDWYNPNTLGDFTIVRKVANEIFTFQNSFRKEDEQDRLSESSIKPENEEIVESK